MCCRVSCPVKCRHSRRLSGRRCRMHSWGGWSWVNCRQMSISGIVLTKLISSAWSRVLLRLCHGICNLIWSGLVGVQFWYADDPSILCAHKRALKSCLMPNICRNAWNGMRFQLPIKTRNWRASRCCWIRGSWRGQWCPVCSWHFRRHPPILLQGKISPNRC